MARSRDPSDRKPTPEGAVLLAGARQHLTIADQSRLLCALNGPLDWTRLLELSLHHDVAPLLLQSLKTIPLPPGIPPVVLTTLQRARAANALRNTLLFADLACVLAWAHERHIDVLALKGAALAETVYGDRALRAMRDVDLLIRAAHLPAFEALLISRGYALDPETARAKQWHREHGYHLAYHKQSDGLPATAVEIHWHLDRPSRRFQLDLEGMWARAAPATIAGVPTRTFSPEDTVLHLCLHTCKHMLTAGLRPYCDLAEVVRGHAAHIDWPAVTRRACDQRISAFVHLPLALARELLDAPVPESVLDRLAPASFDRRLVNIAMRAAAEDPRDASLFQDFFNVRWGANAVRMEVLAKVLSADVVAARYDLPRGSRRIWWRYPTRLAHLYRAYGPGFWQFLRRDRRGVAHAQQLQLRRFLQPFESLPRPESRL
jgi:Uncharacterised nucleotidyltransferase